MLTPTRPRRHLAARSRPNLRHRHAARDLPAGALGPHDRVHHASDQVAVTIHDAIAWTHADLITPRAGILAPGHGQARREARGRDRRAEPCRGRTRSADHLDLGDRVRVIPGARAAASSRRRTTRGRADELGLPERYLLTVGGTEPKKNLGALLDALVLTREATPSLGGRLAIRMP